MFAKMLIANRGEIAVRIIRACREMGIKTVIPYSDSDRASLPVKLADEAYYLGPPPPRESYLRGELLIEIAKRSGADAVHPGYGFLSENAHFAALCREAGVTFVGPDPETIDLMGDKLHARKLAKTAGVPVVPGAAEPLATVDAALQTAREIGFPVMIKAAAGGGGKGMRMVEQEKDFAESFVRASSEALSAFGDGTVYVERFFRTPRHIEIQLVADHHGAVRHLFERDCSVQRRHQKVIEETPSCALDEALRERMGTAAVKVAKASGYKGLGTVEFLYERGEFFFLEMNTRLQVEHPVTELITGIDLVRLQIALADGAHLDQLLPQVERKGHAIECRIYAEDPVQFLPSPGKVRTYRAPDGPFVRNDTYVYPGMDIPMVYDPLISKLAVWGQTRAEAISRMQRALSEYVVTGVRHNLSFHRHALAQEAFLTGEYDTTFIAKHPYPIDTGADIPWDEQKAVLTAAALMMFEDEKNRRTLKSEGTDSKSGASWKGFGYYERLRS